MVRCFMAIEAHTPKLEGYVREIHDLLSRSNVRFSSVDPKITHITLKFLGEVNESMVERVIWKMNELKFKQFKFRAHNVGFFPNQRRPRVVYVGVKDGREEITRLAGKVEEKMVQLGFPPEKRRFEPHITVARIKFPRPKLPTEELVKIGRHINELINVEALKLKRSVLTPQGPIYSDIYVKPFLKI